MPMMDQCTCVCVCVCVTPLSRMKQRDSIKFGKTACLRGVHYHRWCDCFDCFDFFDCELFNVHYNKFE